MKKRTTKEIFAETLLELANRMPVSKITVTLLAKESGMSAKTFYNHFPNIYALMAYIEEEQANQIQQKRLSDNYNYMDYLRDGLKLYESLKVFLRNAFENVYGTESFERIHAETAYKTTLAFLLRRSGLSEVSKEVDFSLRIYVFGLVKVHFDYVFGRCGMTEEEFLENCEANMPLILRPYLLD
ncbi:MAG: TetR family transcriptional regulator [Clostridia bacterium]|nr:TetR family transcriptional regulator [Clostridia bacterium]